MNRHEWAALARGTVYVVLGFVPFLAIGWLGSWWLAGVLLVAGVVGAGCWWLRSPWRRWP